MAAKIIALRVAAVFRAFPAAALSACLLAPCVMASPADGDRMMPPEAWLRLTAKDLQDYALKDRCVQTLRADGKVIALFLDGTAAVVNSAGTLRTGAVTEILRVGSTYRIQFAFDTGNPDSMKRADTFSIHLVQPEQGPTMRGTLRRHAPGQTSMTVSLTDPCSSSKVAGMIRHLPWYQRPVDKPGDDEAWQ